MTTFLDNCLAAGLNTEQAAALEAYADAFPGVGWKNALCDDWRTGADVNRPNGHLLRQVRNLIGPSKLATL